MTEINEKCQGLLKDCQNNLGNSRPYLLKKSLVSIHFKQKIDQSHIRSGISPQQCEENARIIQKMRKNYHKKLRQTSIKKTNLGEDLLTFTPQQYARLQLIDDCQQRGIRYRQKIQEYGEDVIGKQTAVDRLKRLARLDQMTDEVKRNLNWGDVQIENKILRKNSLGKKIGFQKRHFFNHRSSSGNLIADENSGSKGFAAGKKSLNKYYMTLLHKKTFGRKKFLQSQSSMIKTQQGLNLSEKIQIIKDEAQRSTSKLCRNTGPFMTNERKEAMYSCQILRYAKKILDPSELQNLQFSIQSVQGQKLQQDREGEQRGQSQQQSCEAQQILLKNVNRIKAQRKRVIEKMIC